MKGSAVRVRSPAFSRLFVVAHPDPRRGCLVAALRGRDLELAGLLEAATDPRPPVGLGDVRVIAEAHGDTRDGLARFVSRGDLDAAPAPRSRLALHLEEELLGPGRLARVAHPVAV